MRYEFYNRSVKSWFKDNYIEMYSTYKESKFIVIGRFIRTLKNKIYKFMTSISKYVYINKLEHLVIEYNNTHSIIKRKFVDVKSSAYIDFCVENDDKDPKFKVC